MQETELNKLLSEESADTVVIVDFWAEWCGPCKALSPVLDEIAKEQAANVKVIKVNVDNSMELAQKYQVRGIPSLFFIKDNEVKYSLTGNVPKQDLLARIKSLS